MGFSEEDNLKLKPANADRGWVGILRNWKGVLKPRLRAPAGVLDWEAQSAAETFTDLLGQEAGEDDTDDRKLWLATGDGWNLLEACGLVPYKPAKRKQKAKAEHSPVIKYPRPGH